MSAIMETPDSEYAPKFAPFFGMVRYTYARLQLATLTDSLSRPGLPLLCVQPPNPPQLTPDPT